jgi:hypothetical protein
MPNATMRRRDGENSSLALAVPRFQNPSDAHLPMDWE